MREQLYSSYLINRMIFILLVKYFFLYAIQIILSCIAFKFTQSTKNIQISCGQIYPRKSPNHIKETASELKFLSSYVSNKISNEG
jgi:hypothetical protein